MTNARTRYPARAPRAVRFLTCSLVAIAVVAASVSIARPAQAQLEVNPSLGLGKPAGDDSENFGMDVGMALSVGSRFHPNFALHLRGHFDRMSPDEPPATDVSMYMMRLQLHPSAHVVQ